MPNSKTNLHPHFNDLPIGVFDSGVGGLTVLRALQQQLPHESFIYLGDTARLPYGTKDPTTVARYAEQAANALIARGIKMLVIACNTASAAGLSLLQTKFKETPILGVIEAGAQAACAVTKTGTVIVLATEGTTKNRAYELAIKQIRPDTLVLAKACSLFVALAEEGWVDGPIVEATAREYLTPLLNHQQGLQADTLVLGCTHFPPLKKALQAVIGAKFTIVDSAHTTALMVAQQLNTQQLTRQDSTKPAATLFLATDAPERFAAIASRFLGEALPAEHVHLINL